MIDKSQITLIIPHLGGSNESEYALSQCLTSLNETAPDIKKIVAINGRKCLTHSPDIFVAEQGQNTATNAAVATTNTEWIMVSNDDQVYPSGWWEKLTNNLFDSLTVWGELKIKCISPKLIEPIDGAPTFEKYFCGGAGGDFDKQKFLDFAKNHQGQGVRTGFNLPFLIKRELWDTVGGYDINYDPWGSNGDSDLEYKIKLAGVQSYQNTNCVVYHFSQTSGTSHPENRPYWQKNWDYFIEKWGFERASGNAIWQADFDIPQEKLKYKPSWMGKYNAQIR